MRIAPLLSLVGAGLTGALLACATDNIRAEPDSPVPPPSQEVPRSFSPMQGFADLAEQLQPAVVNVEVTQSIELRTPQLPDELWHRFFFGPQGEPEGQEPDDSNPRSNPWGMPEEYERQGQGSGFILSEDGYILTNNHVVADADEVTVRLADEREFEAKVIGTDPRTDVALLEVETDEPLPHVRLGSSDQIRVGDWVVAIGNPLGLSHTVTAGIVSAKGRVIGAGPYDDFIQTDASINFGNSGGPLFNTAGEVVGINTAIAAGGQGIGFAVPIDMVKQILDELRETGTVSRGWIGVSLQELDEDLASALGADVEHGAIVREVYEGTPAQKAGLQSGDIIYRIGDEPVESSDELVRMVGSHRGGETVELHLVREGRKKKLDVTLGVRPSERDLARGIYTAPEPSEGKTEGKPDPTRLEALGLRVQDTPEGVFVAEVADDSPAEGKLSAGDRILEVNRKAISSAADVAREVSRGDAVTLFLVENNDIQRFVAVRAQE